MPSTGLSKSTREEESRVTHAAISIVSPGKDEEEEKNQDRLMLMEATDSRNTKYQFAIVCDGTTTSPYAAQAAEYVAAQAHALFSEKGLQRTVETLKEMRLALLDKPIRIEEGQSALLRSMFEEIVKQKYQNSYQTTFVAVCLKREENSTANTISVKAIGCGDSSLFIFRENGELLYNNANLDGEDDHFKHGSPFTAVLPDCYDPQSNHVLFDFREFTADVHLLLCSDGLYDGFANFKEIREWLNEHHSELTNSELRGKCLSELHERLSNKKGDDDISFIWLRPAAPAAAAEVVEVEKGGDGGEASEEGKAEGGEQGIIAKLIAAILRLFKFSTE